VYRAIRHKVETRLSARRLILVWGGVGLLLCGVVTGWWGCGDPPPEYYVKQLKSRDQAERRKAANQLVRYYEKEEVVPLLLQEAESGYIRVRFEVMKLLGRFKDPRGVPVLIQALDDKSPRVAAVAAWALGELRAPEAMGSLLRYTYDPTPETRAYVIRALGPCHSYEREPALSDSAYGVVFRFLRASTPKVRIAALESMREFGYRGAAGEIIRMSRDPSPEVRHVAVQALGQIAAARTVKESEAVQTGGAAGTITKQRSPGQPVDRIAPVSERMRNNIIEALIVALDEDEYQSIRTKAIRALAEIGERRVIPHLERLQEQGTEDDQREARRALFRLRPSLEEE